MKICTFFGHRNTPEKIEPLLYATLVGLIEIHNVSTFYVGNSGQFDRMVIKLLKHLKHTYNQIDYVVILAYMPGKQGSITQEYDYDTLFPEELSTVPRRFAIDRRNRWMIKQSDYAVTYVDHPFGGAAKFKDLCEKKGLTVHNLADIT